MSRRRFKTKTPSARLADEVKPRAKASGGSTDTQGSFENPEALGVTEGFHLIEEHDRPGFSHTLYPIREYVVTCPYPVRSRAWIAILLNSNDGKVGTLMVDRGGGKIGKALFTDPGRWQLVILPRISEKGRKNFNLDDRAALMFRTTQETHGLGVGWIDLAWRIVHVEYQCTDGVEHVLTGLPNTWDPRSALGVMVSRQIGGTSR